MKHILHLYTLLLLLAGNTVFAQSNYRVSDDRLNIDPVTFYAESPGYVPAAFASFLDKNGYVAQSFYYGKDHLSGEILTQTLNQQTYSYTRGRIHFDIRQNQGKVTLQVSSDCIEIYFPLTEITQTYNPSTNYPINQIYDQKKVFIKESATKETLRGLVAQMYKNRNQLVEYINEYIPPVKKSNTSETRVAQAN